MEFLKRRKSLVENIKMRKIALILFFWMNVLCFFFFLTDLNAALIWHHPWRNELLVALIPSIWREHTHSVLIKVQLIDTISPLWAEFYPGRRLLISSSFTCTRLVSRHLNTRLCLWRLVTILTQHDRKMMWFIIA